MSDSATFKVCPALEENNVILTRKVGCVLIIEVKGFVVKRKIT